MAASTIEELNTLSDNLLDEILTRPRDANWTIDANDFMIQRNVEVDPSTLLGEGGYGAVFLFSLDGSPYALKRTTYKSRQIIIEPWQARRLYEVNGVLRMPPDNEWYHDMIRGESDNFGDTDVAIQNAPPLNWDGKRIAKEDDYDSDGELIESDEIADDVVVQIPMRVRKIYYSREDRVIYCYHSDLQEWIVNTYIKRVSKSPHLTKYAGMYHAISDTRQHMHFALMDLNDHNIQRYFIQLESQGETVRDAIANSLFVQGLIALQHMWDAGVYHMDIHRGNIMVKLLPNCVKNGATHLKYENGVHVPLHPLGGILKIIDFGIATIKTKDGLHIMYVRIADDREDDDVSDHKTEAMMRELLEHVEYCFKEVFSLVAAFDEYSSLARDVFHYLFHKSKMGAGYREYPVNEVGVIDSAYFNLVKYDLKSVSPTTLLSECPALKKYMRSIEDTPDKLYIDIGECETIE